MKLVTRRGQILLESRIISAHDGLFALSKTFTGSDTRALVTHNAFVLAEVEVLEGSLSFLLNAKKVLAPSRFMLAVPPRAALPMVFDRARVWTEGVTGFSTLTIDVPALYASGGAAHLDWGAVRRALCAPVLHRLDPDEGVPLTIARARRTLHELIAHPSPARVAAKQVGVCPHRLSFPVPLPFTHSIHVFSLFLGHFIFWHIECLARLVGFVGHGLGLSVIRPRTLDAASRTQAARAQPSKSLQSKYRRRQSGN